MPEGDTIRRLAERINRRFAGQRVERCVTRDPRLVGVDFTGAVLRQADAHGKHLLIRFDDGRTLHAHLRLEGRWLLGPAATEPDWRRRVELWLADGRLTGLDLPVVGVVLTEHEDRVVGHLGPDLCGPQQPDLDEALDRLAEADGERLAGALLDQRIVAGFGNVYAVELPFIVGVSPSQPVGTIDGLAGLLALGTAVIRANAARGPQNTTGRRLASADHWIYRRGRACPLCATTLDGRDDRHSPWGRVTVWCPACQPLEPTRSVDLDRARRLLALHPARREPTWPRSVNSTRRKRAGHDVASRWVDPPQPGHGAERPVGRDDGGEVVGTEHNRREHGVERAQPLMAFVDVQPADEVPVIRANQRGEQGGKARRVLHGLRSWSPPRSDMGELLHDLHGGRCAELVIGDGGDEVAAVRAQRMLIADRVRKHGRVEDDQNRLPRSSSSSRKNSSTGGTSIGSAARIRSAARRLASASSG